ncbi:cytochrome-c peroxidase [Limnohabitans sp.]|uniref:cytochrome-c peroxidase n=1 Tax=Limnohabitans sp. TaxID=1907725 RepID=UPI0038B8742C
MKLALVFLSWMVCLVLTACGGGSTSTGSPMSAAALLGQDIFKDTRLSGSGRMSCATCHDPDLGHASPFDTPVALGGVNLDLPGLRLPPAIRYLRYNGAFSLAADGSASGGFFWDGRANSLAEQAGGPLLNDHEMANASVEDVVQKIASAPYAAKFKQVFGADIFNDPQVAFDRVRHALARYQQEDGDFASFSSKFDAVNAGRAAFTAQELRGLAWFSRADKGNCAACHPSTRPDNAPAALFTDFSYDSLGVPRNSAVARNSDATFFDLGLCGPVRTDLSARTELCGAFKVPSLRNVALRKRFFHNGRFDNLRQAIQFYVTRDTQAQLWYPQDPLGNVDVYNDLPSLLRGNVNVTEAPYNRPRGQSAALNDSEIDDMVAFLGTLTDGFFAP